MRPEALDRPKRAEVGAAPKFLDSGDLVALRGVMKGGALC